MRELLQEVRKYAIRREPTDDELLAEMNKHILAGTKPEACSASEVITVKDKRYRYHRGYWYRGAGYTMLPSIWPEMSAEEKKPLDSAQRRSILLA